MPIQWSGVPTTCGEVRSASHPRRSRRGKRTGHVPARPRTIGGAIVTVRVMLSVAGAPRRNRGQPGSTPWGAIQRPNQAYYLRISHIPAARCAPPQQEPRRGPHRAPPTEISRTPPRRGADNPHRGLHTEHVHDPRVGHLIPPVEMRPLITEGHRSDAGRTVRRSCRRPIGCTARRIAFRGEVPPRQRSSVARSVSVSHTRYCSTSHPQL